MRQNQIVFLVLSIALLLITFLGQEHGIPIQPSLTLTVVSVGLSMAANPRVLTAADSKFLCQVSG